ncbi:MAG: hypothetical protein AB9921_02515 [Erysipelotrichaceae bacterium]
MLKVKERVELCAGIDILGYTVLYRGNIVYLFGDDVHVVCCDDESGVYLYKGRKAGPWFAQLI